jgi:hypothetical protein
MTTTTPVRPTQPFESTRPSPSLNIDQQLASHVHHLSPNPSLPLPPVEPSRQLSSSPNPNSAKRTCLDASEVANPNTVERNPFSVGKGSSAASMQTPPPTSTTRRKAADFFPPTSEQMTSRRMSSPGMSRKPQPDPNSYPVEASPQMFNNLQFSPDFYQYPLSGPQTAPIFPQHRLFWDNDGSMQNVQPQMQPGHPYATNGAVIMDPFTSPQAINHNFVNPHGFQMQAPYQMRDPRTQGPEYAMSSGPPVVDGAVFPTPFAHPSPQSVRTIPEDSGLFLSSPARRFGTIPEADGSTRAPPQQHLQPYFHQNEETRREREFEMARKAPNKRGSFALNPLSKGSTGRSPPPSSNARPGLKRSVTHTGVADIRPNGKRPNQVAFAASTGNQDRNTSTAPGRSSPQKLDTCAAQIASEPRTRTSLTFVIDEHGRAKTVKKIIPENTDDQMDLDASSGDSDSDSSPNEDFQITKSRNTSFVLPDPDRRKTKLGRLKTASSAHSKNSSYSSTDASSAYSRPISAPTSAHRTQPLPTQYSGPFKQPGLPLSAQSRASFAPSEAETVLEAGAESGDAQHALKQIMRDRANKNPQGFARAQRNSYAGPDSSGNYGFMGDTDSSPTTITDPDIGTPSTDRGSTMSGSTRCVCNSSDNGGHLMIQW